MFQYYTLFLRYELEKKAASAPKPTTAYRTVRAADGSLVQRPVASVRPMQHGARWIPADVWRRQGMTAQEMTLPLGKITKIWDILFSNKANLVLVITYTGLYSPFIK